MQVRAAVVETKSHGFGNTCQQNIRFEWHWMIKCLQVNQVVKMGMTAGSCACVEVW